MNVRENELVAGKLDQAAELLAEQGANVFRVRAYRRAAHTLRQLTDPVSALLDFEGLPGLERLPGVGEGLARAIRDIVRLGYFPMLERLRGEADPIRRLSSVPGIGPRLAERLHEELGLETLEDLEAAAHDGRLEDIAGFGAKRLDAIRDVLAHRLARVRPLPPDAVPPPPVAELLDVDREYREAASARRLTMIAPRRFNPAHEAWLPILHTSRGDHHYTALFSNTARAHRLQRTHDWVVLYCDRGTGGGQWTVVTASHGTLAGRRVVRGREDECAHYYGLAAA
ncbi:MAG TPA: helix-hairpin-helix domain-containing protein [Vicinamibacterales bacterium]|nr:helix-hairpin-helix domain-containing protein [Vicinamibacterales bacterium]